MEELDAVKKGYLTFAQGLRKDNNPSDYKELARIHSSIRDWVTATRCKRMTL
tara:strand:+ start:899 stop:1054 length:156 start_codon:yes stop_codon:yes gene_type:complete